MYRHLPQVTESVEELESFLRKSASKSDHERIHTLYLIKTSQVKSRTSLASMLGRHRLTIGEWLRRYESGGISKLLEKTPSSFQVFIDEFDKQYPNSTNILIMDRGAFHAAKKLKMPDNIIPLFLPPYSPELNPIERYWKHFKDQIAWRLFDELQKLQDYVATLIKQVTPEIVRSLTQFPFFMEATMNS